MVDRAAASAYVHSLTPQPLYQALPASGTVEGFGVEVHGSHLSIEAVWTGTPTGTFTLQYSWNSTTWYTFSAATFTAQPAGSASGAIIEAYNVPGRLFRLLYTATSGTGTLSALSAQSDAAGAGTLAGSGGPVTSPSAPNDIPLAQYLVTPPVLTNAQFNALQVDASGYLRTREMFAPVYEDNTNLVAAVASLPTANSTYAWSNARNTALATNLVIKASPGKIRRIDGIVDLGVGAGTFFVMLLDEVSAVNGTRVVIRLKKIVVPVAPIDMPFSFDFAAEGVASATGLTVCLSTTSGTTVTLAGAFLWAEATYK